MTLVVIAESREKGEKIAAAMGLSKRGDKRISGAYNGKPAVLCWASGHLFQPIDPEQAKPDCNWFDPKSLLPLPVPGKMKLSERGGPLFKVIKDVLKDATEVWIGTDADREGEAIGRDAIRYAQYKGPVKRLWFSGALEKADIDKAIRDIYESADKIPTWRAQQARQGADWLWQFLVRAYTMSGRNGLMGDELGKGKGSKGVVSVGRVQTATLKMIVDRDNQIANFKKIDYFLVSPFAGGLSWNYRPPAEVEPADGIQFDDDGKPYFISESKANAFKERLEGSTMVVTKAAKGKKLSNPPLPHSLTSLQRTMSKKGISAKDTLQITDQIRLAGYLTYPRTEHGELPISLYSADDIKNQLTAVAALPELREAAKAMAALHPQENPPACYTTKPMEHHGIIPTGKVPNFNDGSWDKNRIAIFTECARAFVTALHPPAQFKTLSVEGAAQVDGMGEENPSRFHRQTEQLVVGGWMELGGKDLESLKAELPNIKDGDELNIESATVTAKQTTPPKPYTENTLLAAMANAGRQAAGEDAKLLREVSGIGTPATRANIIEILTSRDYISAGKTLVSTPKGRALVKHVPEDLSSVVITAKWERQLREIEQAGDEETSTELRNKFLREQMGLVEKHITKVIEIMSDIDTSKKQGGSNKPTPKMQSLIKKVGATLGIDTEEALSSFDKGKEFLDENLSKMPKTNQPTSKMLAFAEKLSADKNLPLPVDVSESFDSCRDFIDLALKK